MGRHSLTVHKKMGKAAFLNFQIKTLERMYRGLLPGLVSEIDVSNPEICKAFDMGMYVAYKRIKERSLDAKI